MGRRLNQQVFGSPSGPWWCFVLRLQRGRLLGPRKGQPCHTRRRKHHQACCYYCCLRCRLQDAHEHWIDHWILYRHCRYSVVLIGHERLEEINIQHTHFLKETTKPDLSQRNIEL